MSAVVCGTKRSFFEELPLPSKKIKRCSSSSSPTRVLSPPPPPPSAPTQLLHQLSSLFPHMETQVLERVLQDCRYDVDSAIKRLSELSIGSAEANGSSAEDTGIHVEQGTPEANEEAAAAAASGDSSSQSNLPTEGAEWVEIFVKEMMSATSLDDARGRARQVLEVLEQSISGRAREQAGECFQKENMMLKEHIQGLLRENTILKRAVAIQHERQKEYDDRNRELQQLKQLVAQYQEQLRVLEVNNYALSVHLRQAQSSNSIPGRFNPDVF